jgi:hypothetical protein
MLKVNSIESFTGGQPVSFPEGIEFGTIPNLEDLALLMKSYMRVGKIEWFDHYFEPSSMNPWFNLSQADTTISNSNWPELVTHWRTNKYLSYLPGTISEQSDFVIDSYSITSNVVSVVLSNLTPEIKILAALAEDQAVHASYVNWIPITINTGFGSIPAGDYGITNINTGTRTITFSCTAANISSTPIVGVTCKFYPHRVSGSSTTARHLSIAGRTLVAQGDSDTEVFYGLRRRDRGQGHRHLDLGHTHSVTKSNELGGNQHPYNYGEYSNPGSTALGYANIGDPSTDGSNGTPRTGKTTDPRALGAIPYIWGYTYSV